MAAHPLAYHYCFVFCRASGIRRGRDPTTSARLSSRSSAAGLVRGVQGSSALLLRGRPALFQ
eukprot:137585-Pyramimonas_sp.AAC.1